MTFKEAVMKRGSSFLSRLYRLLPRVAGFALLILALRFIGLGVVLE